jgi:signal transduction histidine kinase
MGKKSGYIWVISLLLLVIVVDAYYQVMSATVPIWQTEWFLWRVCAFIVILIGVAYYYYLQASKKRILELEAFKAKMIEAQEKDWKMTAGELHDSIGQNLSAINIFLQQSIKSGITDTDKLEQASELTVETINEVRRISQKLYPKQIERLGLTIAIQAMTERLASASGIKFNLNIENVDTAFSEQDAVQYFRIIQEVLNNTIKHSAAENVGINIKRTVMFVVTEIEDDGVGFEVSNSAKLGFGLINIEERIRIVKGNYEFLSEEGKGTRFKITIPTRKESKRTHI